MNHLFLLNNHQRKPAGSKIQRKQTNIDLHVMFSEAVQLPVARDCIYRKFLQALSSARAEDGDGGLLFSSSTAEKIDTHRYHPQPGSVPEGTTDASLI